MDIKIYEVGGCIRDELLGVKTKDYDYAVEIGIDAISKAVGDTASFIRMEAYLRARGFEIFLSTPEYATVRARFPSGSPKQHSTADFVLCRKDGPSSDGRRPDYVTVGTLYDDLARRDFTVNAMARQLDLETMFSDDRIIDPFHGRSDLKYRLLRFVGDPMTRLREDGLRALRAIRFTITKGFTMTQGVRDALREPETATLLAGVSIERRREELEKCFHHDTLATLDMLTGDLPRGLLEAIFEGDLRLAATQRSKLVRT